MSNDLTKDEVNAVAQKAGCAWLHEPLAQRFATLCRAPLVAELEQAKKDAERYRWLVSQPNGGFFHPVFAVNNFLSWKSKAQYDAAIDAAIVKEQS
jgi:hypothetical protein